MNNQKSHKLFYKLIVTILTVSLLFQNCQKKVNIVEISKTEVSDMPSVLQTITESEDIGTVLPIVGGACIAPEDSMELISTDNRSTSSELEKTNMVAMSSSNKRKVNQVEDEKVFVKSKKTRQTIEEGEEVEESGERESLLSRVPDELLNYILRYLPNDEVAKCKLVNKCLKNFAEGILKDRLTDAVNNNDFQSLLELLYFGTNPNDSYYEADNVPLLHLAVEKDNLEMVSLLLKRGANVNIKDDKGLNALYKAHENKHKRIVDLLLNYEMVYPLHEAIKNNDADEVKRLLDMGADIEFRQPIERYGVTPLCEAIACGNLAIVEELLNRGAAINTSTVINYFRLVRLPLHVAAAKGNLEMFELLLKKGADLTLKDDNSNTILHSAAEGGNIEILNLVLELTPEPRLEFSEGYNMLLGINKDKLTPLHLAACNGHLEVVKLLLEKGVDVNFRYYLSHQYAPLHLAADKEHLEVVKLLLEKGADVDFSDKNGKTLLHLAAEKGHLEVVKLLLEKGIDVNFSDNNGNTPLHLAAEKGHLEVVKLLLEKKADLVVDNKGNNLVHLAASSGNLELLKLIIKIIKGQIKALSSFQGPLPSELKSFLNIKNVDGKTPLHLATIRHHIEVVSFLLKTKVVEVDDDFISNAGEICNLEFLKLVIDKATTQTVLRLLGSGGPFSGCLEKLYLVPQFQEARKKYIKSLINRLLLIITSLEECMLQQNKVIEIIEFLLNEGADVNAIDENGNTPLHCAISESYNFRIVQLLLKKGANVHAVNKEGRTPLLEAICRDCLENEIVYLLLRKGADIHATTRTGETPLHLAFRSLRPQAVKALVQKGAKITFDNNLPWNLLQLIYNKHPYCGDFDSYVHEFGYYLDHNFRWKMETLHAALSLGIDINSKDQYGDTLLHVAVEHLCRHRDKKFLYLIKTLINLGADINAVNNNGYTPLALGFEKLQQNYKEIFTLLGGGDS